MHYKHFAAKNAIPNGCINGEDTEEDFLHPSITSAAPAI